MPLINSRLLKKLLTEQEIPTPQLEILSAWRESIQNRSIYSQNETSLDAHFIQKFLVEILAYEDFGKNRSLWKNKPVGSGNVDIALGNFAEGADKIIAPFELKGAKTRDLDAIMSGRHKSPVQQAWEYAMDAPGSQWVLVSNYLEIRLYAVGYGRKVYESWDLSKLIEPLEYARFQLLLNAKQLLSGATAEILRQSEQTEKEITQQLYADYKKLRETLLNTLAVDNPEIAPLDLIRLVQKLLDRVLFIAFAEDRGLLPGHILSRAYQEQNPFNPQPIWDNFKGLFRAINAGNPLLNVPAYNGGLFQFDAELDNLVVTDELCKHFKELGEYDFASEISVTVLGHIFEQSITDIEDLQAKVRGKHRDTVSKRKRDGIFYTPPYITRYIVEQAVGGWLAARKAELGFHELPVLNEADYDSIRHITRGKRKGIVEYNENIARHLMLWERYKTVLSQIKVLDPACGSGAFLNEVFDFLYQEGQLINERLTTLNGGQAYLFRWDTHILANNLYGVDINYESVEITKLSLWLKTANKQEKLTYLDDNIRCGDSLIDDPAVAGDKAFQWNFAFAEIMNAGGFDVVVGNPPYGSFLVRNQKQFIEKTYACFKGNFDIYSAFIQKAFLLLKEAGYWGYITPTSWQTGQYYSCLRKLLCENGKLICGIKLPYNAFEDAYVDTGIYIVKREISDAYTSKVYEFPFYYKIKLSIEQEAKLQVLDSGLWSSLESKKIVFNPAFYLLNRKIQHFGLALENISESVRGILAEKSDIVQTKQQNSKPFFTGNVYRYELQPDFLEVIYGDNLKEKPKDYMFFTGERILVRRLVNRQQRVMATLTSTEFVTKKDLYTFVVTDGNYQTEYVLAIINSKLIAFLLTKGSTNSTKDDFSQVTLADIRSIKIPSHAVAQQRIVEKVKHLLRNYEILHLRITKFNALLQSDFGLSKLSRKLEAWYELTFTEFLEELSKAKVKLSLQQKSEWMDYFTQQKQQAQPLQMEITQLDNTIDQMVYVLYGLSAEEIKLVEESL